MKLETYVEPQSVSKDLSLLKKFLKSPILYLFYMAMQTLSVTPWSIPGPKEVAKSLKEEYSLNFKV